MLDTKNNFFFLFFLTSQIKLTGKHTFRVYFNVVNLIDVNNQFKICLKKFFAFDHVEKIVSNGPPLLMII